MGSQHGPRDLLEVLSANRDDLRRRSRAERVRSLWLWIGILTGPVALLVVRIASDVLLSQNCSRVVEPRLLGHSPLQVATGAICLVAALLTIGAGLLAWRIWRWTSLPGDEVDTEDMPRVPFWAMGGVLVSAFCLAGIVYTAGLALALSGGCS